MKNLKIPGLKLNERQNEPVARVFGTSENGVKLIETAV